jgi:hypothetical protein
MSTNPTWVLKRFPAGMPQNDDFEMVERAIPTPGPGELLVSKPVKEEEDAQARDADFDPFFAQLLSALGFAANARLPAWWQGWPARLRVQRWIRDLGLSEDRIIEVATETRGDHPNPRVCCLL